MRERMTRLLLLGVGVGVGVLAQPLLVGVARGGEDPLVGQPAPVVQAAADAVEYNIYLPPAYPKAEKVVQKLDELGKSGWRLVTTTTSNGGTSGFIFMRARR
jgi:hypothetical protein